MRTSRIRHDQRNSRPLAVILLLSLLAAVPAQAQKRPIPPALLAAKVVFLTGQPRINPLLPTAEAALHKWARWEVTFDSELTDLILLITAKADPDIFINPAAAELATRYPQGSFVFLHVIDRNNGTVVWSEAVKGRMADGKLGAKLIDNFRKRLPKK